MSDPLSDVPALEPIAQDRETMNGEEATPSFDELMRGGTESPVVLNIQVVVATRVTQAQVNAMGPFRYAQLMRAVAAMLDAARLLGDEEKMAGV